MMDCRGYPIVIMSAAASLAAPAAALGASFDCGKASAGREKLICHDPKLSELDGKLGQLYRERMALLSAQGAELLLKSQRGWLRYAATVCPLTEPKTDLFSPEQCFERRYLERIEELAEAGKRMGGWTFTRVDQYAAVAVSAADKDTDTTGSAQGFYIQRVGYPQIDAPLTAAARAWNKHVEKTPGAASDCAGDNEVGYTIGYANRSVVSVFWTFGVYCHGTPHGMYSLAWDNTVLTPPLRKLEVRDVFGASPNWSNKLRRLFDAALRKANWPGFGDDQEEKRSRLEETMMQFETWSFTKDGLKVDFAQADGGCYACNPQPFTVAWADLKPFMGSGALLP